MQQNSWCNPLTQTQNTPGISKLPQDNAQKDTKNSIVSDIKGLMQSAYIMTVPSYGNGFFFTIGIYLLELFVILGISGMIMLVFGPYWWDTTAAGTFIRSIHAWAAEAFVTLMLLHMFVNFATSAYRKKKTVWMIGVVLLLLVFLEYAFGIGLRGGLVSQWNDKAGADLWNGLGLGYWVNPLNQSALLGWHVAIVPILLIALIGSHYMMVKRKGLSVPYRNDIPYSMVPADHKRMYKRMVYIFAVVLLFAIFLRAPYVSPLTTQGIAQQTPGVFAATMVKEFNYSSGTATYFDTIDPYNFSTRQVYVVVPYMRYVNSSGSVDALSAFYAENLSAQSITIAQALAYFEANGSISEGLNSTNPIVSVASRLTLMAQQDIYGPILSSEESNGLDQTYEIRLYADTRVLYSSAAEYGLRTRQWGMIKSGGKWWQIGSYWVAPYNLLEIWFPNNTDFENGVMALAVFLVVFLFPYIPKLNELPDKLKLYKIFWNRFTIPEMKKKNKR